MVVTACLATFTVAFFASTASIASTSTTITFTYTGITLSTYSTHATYITVTTATSTLNHIVKFKLHRCTQNKIQFGYSHDKYIY